MHDSKMVYWLCKVLVARGVVSLIICQKFPPASTEPVPVGSKTKPIINSGSTSVTAYWRRRPSCSDVGKIQIPLQPVARPWWGSCAHAAHGGPQNLPAASEGSHTRAAKCLKEGCDPMGSPCWSRLLAGPVAPRKEKLMLEQVCWQDLWLRRESTLEQEEGRVGVKRM